MKEEEMTRELWDVCNMRVWGRPRKEAGAKGSVDRSAKTQCGWKLYNETHDSEC